MRDTEPAISPDAAVQATAQQPDTGRLSREHTERSGTGGHRPPRRPGSKLTA
jgi:hypothetical protein